MLNTTERLLLTPEETADAIGVSRSKVYDLIHRGELPSLRIGTILRVPVVALKDWIAAHQTPPVAH